MNTVNLIRAKVFNYIDLSYFIKFALLFTSLYYFNILIVRVSESPTYSEWVTLIDYVSLLRRSIINGANLITNVAGIKSFVAAPFILYNPDGSGVSMGWQCAGLGV